MTHTQAGVWKSTHDDLKKMSKETGISISRLIDDAVIVLKKFKSGELIPSGEESLKSLISDVNKNPHKNAS